MTQPLLGWGLTPQALTNVTPFTYRDNATYIQLMQDVRDKVNEVISVVNLNAGSESSDVAAINAAYTALVAQWNAILPNLDAAAVTTLVNSLTASLAGATTAANAAAATATTATESANAASAAAVTATNSLTTFQTAITASVASQVTTAVAGEATIARAAESALTASDATLNTAITTEAATARAAELAGSTYAATLVVKGTKDLYIADYGAVGTADDSATFVAALAATRAVNGRLVLGLGATYIVSTSLDPTGTMIEGNNSTIKNKAGVTATWNVFQPSGACTISNLVIDLNKANNVTGGSDTQGNGVYGYSGTGWTGVITIENVRVINGYSGGFKFGTLWSLTDAVNAPPSSVLLTNVSASGTQHGIRTFGTSGVTIVNAHIDSTTGEGIYDYLSLNTKIIGSTITNTAGHGIVTAYSNAFTCHSNKVKGSGGGGIVIGGGDPTLKECVDPSIAGNIVSNSILNGISIDTTKSSGVTAPVVVNGVVQGNILKNNTIHGIYLHNSEYVAVNGNVSYGNANAGLALDSLFVSISGNNFYNNAYGISFHGVLGDPYGYHSIGRNVVVNNTTANFVYDTLGVPGSAMQLYGVGVPAIPAPVGSTYARTDGGTATSFYVKESGGVTSAGWVAK